MTHGQNLSSSAIVRELRKSVRDVLLPLLSDAPFALLDFPDHGNVGDSAIWLGETKFLLGELGVMPSYVASIEDYEEADLRQLVPKGTILIHGGGNFGDIWPKHQEFRHRLLTAFPDRQIVQLPQSIHFKETSELKRSADAIKRHGRVVVMARDKESFELASESFPCSVCLSPDLAFCIGPAARPYKPSVECLYLLRTDREKALRERPEEIPGRRIVCDWLEERALDVKAAMAVGIAKGALFGRFQAMGRRQSKYQSAAAHRFRRGVRLLSKGKVVITDRLHAHIICVLLDIPHAILDNNYGKLERFVSAWTSEYQNLYSAPSLREAENWASRL